MVDITSWCELELTGSKEPEARNQKASRTAAILVGMRRSGNGSNRRKWKFGTGCRSWGSERGAQTARIWCQVVMNGDSRFVSSPTRVQSNTNYTGCSCTWRDSWLMRSIFHTRWGKIPERSGGVLCNLCSLYSPIILFANKMSCSRVRYNSWLRILLINEMLYPFYCSFLQPYTLYFEEK